MPSEEAVASFCGSLPSEVQEDGFGRMDLRRLRIVAAIENDISKELHTEALIEDGAALDVLDRIAARERQDRKVRWAAERQSRCRGVGAEDSFRVLEDSRRHGEGPDFTLGRRGFGNPRWIVAGPCREEVGAGPDFGDE